MYIRTIRLILHTNIRAFGRTAMVERNPRVNVRIDGDFGASACTSARARALEVARDLLSFDPSPFVHASRARVILKFPSFGAPSLPCACLLIFPFALSSGSAPCSPTKSSSCGIEICERWGLTKTAGTLQCTVISLRSGMATQTGSRTTFAISGSAM